MRRYAEGTSVPVDRTREEIRKLLVNHGAGGFIFGEANAQALIAFEMKTRRLRFVVPMPSSSSKPRLNERQLAAETRRRWRALLLVLKAKLEAVAGGIVTFDHEFLAHIVVEGSSTVGDRIVPTLGDAVITGRLPPLLGSGDQ